MGNANTLIIMSFCAILDVDFFDKFHGLSFTDFFGNQIRYIIENCLEGAAKVKCK